MSGAIHLGAIVVREGRLLLRRPGAGGHWELPGGRLLPEHDDVDAAMDAILGDMGVDVPAIEEDFLQTVYLPAGDGHVVYNLYAPTEWTGEPAAAPGHEHGWFGLEELADLPMNDVLRATVLEAFGLREPKDNSPDILAGVVAGTRSSLFGPAQPQPGPAAVPEALARASLASALESATLDPRTTQLIAVAILAALGHDAWLEEKLAAAVQGRATRDEVVEVLKLVAGYAGVPVAASAWQVMERVFAGTDERGRT
jgi:alkylhydroperoxidase/carboxymuconolactone decarboxylase family protein YurZ/ADP-ribose pyrophosphatase YjhB (NUDIX family)